MKNAYKDDSFSARLSSAAQAKQDSLKRARAIARPGDPALAERQLARQRAAAARDARQAEREAARAAEIERRAAERAAKDFERLAAEAAETERLAAEAEARALALEAVKVQQKAARDARYAARKARQR
ncbi:hypothetical protein GCM10017083_40810 [Thalassobaculum fulvum]|uniref:Uncharacterized protein n=1 Tax=Thalassobaculum fulvum TaxID=1633335 RepID=A0A919CR62_9PROT|nr:DUF6481 family protein [Thalassobaculum fulvum]GHD58202.1 hypothetical protein GCM10017083_40810 [Thalassobaculum fulvum]